MSATNSPAHLSDATLAELRAKALEYTAAHDALTVDVAAHPRTDERTDTPIEEYVRQVGIQTRANKSAFEWNALLRQHGFALLADYDALSAEVGRLTGENAELRRAPECHSCGRVLHSYCSVCERSPR